MRQLVLISSLPLVLGTAENVGDAYQFRALLGPREGRDEAAGSDFLSTVGGGDPRECRGCVIPPSFGSPRSGVTRPFLIFSPCLALGTPENAGVA